MEDDIGTRVGAILEADGNIVRFLGYGVYEGDHQYPTADQAETLEEAHPELLTALTAEELEIARSMFNKFRNNPRIKLDNGEIVWGRECWWAPENTVKEQLEGKTVVMCKILRDEVGRAIEAVDVKDVQ